MNPPDVPIKPDVPTKPDVLIKPDVPIMPHVPTKPDVLIKLSPLSRPPRPPRFMQPSGFHATVWGKSS